MMTLRNSKPGFILQKEQHLQKWIYIRQESKFMVHWSIKNERKRYLKDFGEHKAQNRRKQHMQQRQTKWVGKVEIFGWQNPLHYIKTEQKSKNNKNLVNIYKSNRSKEEREHKKTKSPLVSISSPLFPSVQTYSQLHINQNQFTIHTKSTADQIQIKMRETQNQIDYWDAEETKTNLIEEDLATGEDDIDEDIAIGHKALLRPPAPIRHCWAVRSRLKKTRYRTSLHELFMKSSEVRPKS